MGNICCAWQTHSEKTGSIERNMLKMASIWSCIFTHTYWLMVSSQKQWENEPTLVSPFDYIICSCSWNVLYVSGITRHLYRTNIWQYGSWWNQGKLDKLSIFCSQITPKRKLYPFSVALLSNVFFLWVTTTFCQAKYVYEWLETLMERNIKLKVRRKI